MEVVDHGRAASIAWQLVTRMLKFWGPNVRNARHVECVANDELQDAARCPVTLFRL